MDVKELGHRIWMWWRWPELGKEEWFSNDISEQHRINDFLEQRGLMGASGDEQIDAFKSTIGKERHHLVRGYRNPEEERRMWARFYINNCELNSQKDPELEAYKP